MSHPSSDLRRRPAGLRHCAPPHPGRLHEGGGDRYADYQSRDRARARPDPCPIRARIYAGDQLVYVIARHRIQAGCMKGGVVGTLITNLGTEHALGRIHVPFERAKVGDRYVLERLHANGWILGGETSGHILCLDKHTTGDGIVSALQVLRALRETGETLDAFTADLETYPQVMINVPVAKGFKLDAAPAVRAAVAEADRK